MGTAVYDADPSIEPANRVQVIFATLARAAATSVEVSATEIPFVGVAPFGLQVVFREPVESAKRKN